MGSTSRIVLPNVSFSGQEDICEFLRDFEIFVLVNERAGRESRPVSSSVFKRRSESLLSSTRRIGQEEFQCFVKSANRKISVLTRPRHCGIPAVSKQMTH